MITLTRAPRLVVHENRMHYLFMLVKHFFIRRFNTALRDFSGDRIRHNDRVFDLDYQFFARKVDDKANFGTLLIDDAPDSIIGYQIKWDNGEVTKCLDPGRLVKWHPEKVKVKI